MHSKAAVGRTGVMDREVNNSENGVDVACGCAHR